VAPWNGGTLTTAGNLVFQGTADGRFIAYNATSGEKLWKPDRHRRGRRGLDLHDRRRAVRFRRGRLGGVFGITQRVTDRKDGHGLHFRGRGKAPLPEFTKYQIGNLLPA